ncbi:MAG: restriction endonuclease subunit S [Planctomycetota bacterium]
MRLGDLVRVKHGWPFKSESFSEALSGKPIVVAVGNFRYTGGFRFDVTPTKEYLAEYPREYELSPGDILLVMTCQTPGGEILGVPARIPDDGRVYLHNQRLGRVVIERPDITDSGFLYQVFLSREFNQELFATSSGTKILHTAPSRIEAFRFKLPSLPEQEAIAAVLTALDGKIELNRSLSRTLESTCAALFKSWFVDFDPVIAKAEGKRPPRMTEEFARLFPSSLVDVGPMRVPQGWDVEPLDSIARYQNGLALQKHRPSPGGPRLPVIKIAQLRAGGPGEDEWASCDINPKCVLDDGDVVFSWSGSLLVTIWCGGKGALNQHLFKVTSERFPKWFYHQWTLVHLPEFQAIAADKATTMGHIRRYHLTDALCCVPPPNVIELADELLSPCMNRIVATRLESRTLEALRGLLLPKLLSGEVTVRDAERVVEEAV